MKKGDEEQFFPDGSNILAALSSEDSSEYSAGEDDYYFRQDESPPGFEFVNFEFFRNFENNVFNFPRGLYLFYRTNRVESNITVAILAQGADKAMRSRSLLFRDIGIFLKTYFWNFDFFENNVFNFPRGLEFVLPYKPRGN